jgi:hypothetical protein
MIDDECGAVDGIKIDRRNRSTRRKSAPMPLCPPKISRDLTNPRTRAASVESRRLTAWAMARPSNLLVPIPESDDKHRNGLLFALDTGQGNRSCKLGIGRDVAQAASRWLPTTAARVRVREACGVCGGHSGTGAGFLRVLRFPLSIIPPNFPPSQSLGACKNR